MEEGGDGGVDRWGLGVRRVGLRYGIEDTVG